MVTRLAGLAIAAVVLLYAVSAPHPAAACTVTPDHSPFDGADVVLEGRVLSWVPGTSSVLVLVHRVYQGYAALVTEIDSTRSSCSITGFVEQGDYLVIGVSAAQGALIAGWPGIAYAAPERTGERYEEAIAAAHRRFGAGRPPALPATWGGWWAAW